MSISRFMTESRPAYAPAFWLGVRLILGVEWLRGAWEKIGDAGWTASPRGSAVEGFLNGALQKASTQGAHPEVQQWFADAIDKYFMPHTELFAYLVAYGELLVGIALVIGLFTRFSVLFGAMMNVTFIFAGTTSSNPQMLLLGLAILFAGKNAGEFGVDGWALPWIRERAGQSLVNAWRTAVVAVAILGALWLAWITTDTLTWIAAVAIALIVFAIVRLTHAEIPAAEQPPVHHPGSQPM